MFTRSSKLVGAHPTPQFRAFTLIEVMIGMTVVGIVFVALYTGITSGFGAVSVARENLRATQVLLDRMEEVRLYTWDQVCSYGSSTSYIPSSFTVPFFPATTNYAASDLTVGTTPANSAGSFVYYGAVTVADAELSDCNYSNDMKRVTVTLTWTNGAAVRQRAMTTYVCQYGMQNYLY